MKFGWTSGVNNSGEKILFPNYRLDGFFGKVVISLENNHWLIFDTHNQLAFHGGAENIDSAKEKVETIILKKINERLSLWGLKAVPNEETQ